MKATNFEGERWEKYSKAFHAISYAYRAGRVVFS